MIESINIWEADTEVWQRNGELWAEMFLVPQYSTFKGVAGPTFLGVSLLVHLRLVT